jgi:hypothetical protein
MECVICYDVIGDTNKCVTPCGHNFCFNCIMKSTQYNTKCPYCRTELREATSDVISDVEYEEDDDDDEDEDEDEDEDDDLLSNIDLLTSYDLNAGTYDDNGYYNYPIVIETPFQLQSTLQKCIPEGYTKQYKDLYERHEEESDVGDNYSLFIDIKKQIPGFNYSDMSNNPINMSYIEYAQQKELSDIKCYDIFKRTRLIMKVIDDKKRHIYNAIRRIEMGVSHAHMEEFHVIRAVGNIPAVWNIINGVPE